LLRHIPVPEWGSYTIFTEFVPENDPYSGEMMSINMSFCSGNDSPLEPQTATVSIDSISVLTWDSVEQDGGVISSSPEI
jgi:hypothetical protein